MTFFTRVATVATIFFTVTGLAAPTSAVNAAELAQAALTVPTVVSLNLPIIDPVPALPKSSATLSSTQASVATAPDQRADAVQLRPAVVETGDTVAYPTLAAAVAAQPASSDADEQLRCLATSVYFESKGEPLAGQLAVAQVILNRVATGRFGRGVCGVVRQPGQFSFVRGGVMPSVDAARPAYRTALAIARVALAEAWDSAAERALYFHARRVSPSWNRTRIASIGNHVFYR